MTVLPDVSARGLRPFYFFLFATYGGFLPFFPTWLEARGVRGVSMSAIMALGPAMGIVGPPGFGALSDWLGLRAGLLRIVTAGALVATFVLSLPAAVGASYGLPLLFGAMFLFQLSRAPAVAIADVIAVESVKAKGHVHGDEEEREEGARQGRSEGSYGAIRLWGSVGFLVASALVGRALDVGAALPLPLFFVVSSAVTFGLAFLLEAPPPSRARRLGAQMKGVLRDRTFALVLASAFLGYGAHVCYDICFSLHLKALGHGSTTVGVAWAIGTLAEVGLMAISGRILARFSASRLLVAAFATGSLRWLLIAFVTDVRVLLPLQPLHAITFALFWVTSLDRVKARAPREVLATAQGVFNAAIGAGAVVGMLVWGTLFDALGGRATFVIASVVAACAALIAAAIGGERAPARE